MKITFFVLCTCTLLFSCGCFKPKSIKETRSKTNTLLLQLYTIDIKRIKPAANDTSRGSTLIQRFEKNAPCHFKLSKKYRSHYEHLKLSVSEYDSAWHKYLRGKPKESTSTNFTLQKQIDSCQNAIKNLEREIDDLQNVNGSMNFVVDLAKRTNLLSRMHSDCIELETKRMKWMIDSSAVETKLLLLKINMFDSRRTFIHDMASLKMKLKHKK